eukprot:scaffold21146_cov54-Attheya_sp.AAC.4
MHPNTFLHHDVKPGTHAYRMWQDRSPLWAVGRIRSFNSRESKSCPSGNRSLVGWHYEGAIRSMSSSANTTSSTLEVRRIANEE